MDYFRTAEVDSSGALKKEYVVLRSEHSDYNSSHDLILNVVHEKLFLIVNI